MTPEPDEISICREKLIKVIKEWRAESEKLWSPSEGYESDFDHGRGFTYDKCADQLEKLVSEKSKEVNHENPI